MRTTHLLPLMFVVGCAGGKIDLGDDTAGPSGSDTSAEDSRGFDDGTGTCTGSDLVPVAVIRTDDDTICTDCDRHDGLNLWAGITNACEEQVGVGLDYACLVTSWAIKNSAGEEVFFADSGCADNYHLVYIESGSTRYDRYSGNVALTEDDSYTFTAQMGTVDDLQATVDFTVF